MLTLATLMFAPVATAAPIQVPVLTDVTVALQPDLRRCAAPLCGGWWYVEIHELQTTCLDGTVAEACYIAELDFSSLDLQPAQEQAVTEAAATMKLWLTGDVVPRRSSFGPVAVLEVHGGERTFTP